MVKRLKVIEPKWLIVVVFFISGIFLGGITLYLWYGVSSIPGYKIHSVASEYKYINPLLGVEFEQKSFSAVNASVQLKLQGAVDKSKRDGTISDGGVYYRDLEPGNWAEVNENISFSPGKLLKIPLMIAYFKLAEGDPSILEKRITNSLSEENINDIFQHEKGLVKGETYSVSELIEYMITYSDDESADLLFDNIDKKDLNEIFSDLGISFTEEKTTTDYISLKLYSLFFRVLHNATYLDREFSEKALTLLSVSDRGSVAGVAASIPKSVPIVQKYGGRKYSDGGNSGYELYDCGIIYYPGHPYLLCATAKGATVSGVQEFFKEVSKEIYSETEFRYKM